MVELPQAHFDRVKPLFDTGQTNSPMLFSTLDGRTLGRAFVDNVDAPTSCLLVMGFQNFAFTHATVDQPWLHETTAALRPQLGFTLNWPASIAAALQPPPNFGRTVSGHEFMSYSAQGDFNLPANRQWRRMDAELFARAMWRDIMLGGFGTVENFLDNGMGVCVMDGEEICSEAYAVFLGAGKFEIGIVTNEQYRKQGNAYLACKQLLQLVAAIGYPPHWSYFEGNVGSAATARKLGFGDQRDYQWYTYPRQ